MDPRNTIYYEHRSQTKIIEKKTGKLMGFKFSKQESLSCHELYEGTGLIQLHGGNEIRLLLNKRSGMCREGMVFIFFPKKSNDLYIEITTRTHSQTPYATHSCIAYVIVHALLGKACEIQMLLFESK